MLVLVVASIIALIVTFYASRDEIPFGLEFAFLLITFVAAIHYNYGNDYQSYATIFDVVTRHDFSYEGLIKHTFYKESGWALLCFIFKPVGFLWMVVFLSIVQNLIYYSFVRFYVPKEWWLLGVFIYLTSKSLYILNMSMMRQGLAIALFLLAWPFIQKKKPLGIAVATLIIFVATTIHSSALILYPFVFWGYIPMKNGRINGIILLILFVILFSSVDFLNSILIQFAEIEDLQEYFKMFENRATSKFGLGFILLTIPFVISVVFLIFNKNATTEEKQFVTIASLGSLIIPFVQIISMLARVGYYFAPFTIVSVPITYRWLPNPLKKIFVSLFVFIMIFDYWNFFHSDIFTAAYLTFHSVFEVIF
ncbi:EpsG family protein [Fibrobacter sp. UWB5]|uniref:EpsG family protein n=1 Tax=Fibrobacter sp. UWB5 TaxID=1964360 RepID=UPI000B51FDE6|nr:EpsG family protein [Fibrobacter sp. UWB5]OWV14371.1 hypothetical protein B7989_02640 [Fibrobacter sp. UWB5]